MTKTKGAQEIADDDLFQFFTLGLFHDGEIIFDEIDLELKKVIITFRNVYAVNRVVDFRSEHGLDWRGIAKKDFRTQVSFFDVTEFSVRWTERLINLEYHHAKLSKRGGVFCLTVFLPESKNVCFMKMKFKSAIIENIARRIKKYVGDADAESFISPGNTGKNN